MATAESSVPAAAQRPAPAHWDLVLTCFEPVRKVTGGIGSYTRLLLEILGRRTWKGRAPRVLFLTSVRNGRASDGAVENAGAATVFIPETFQVDGVPLNNLEGPYRHFSYGVMLELMRLQEDGHTFGLAEFPDYGNEGYFALKARAAGRLQLPKVAIRLHSPDEMLFEDNDAKADASVDTFRQFEEMRNAYRMSDVILFGGDAMLERVAGMLPEPMRGELRAKSVKVPHPWPEPGTLGRAAPHRSGPVNVACVGRLEYRKGVDLLVRAAVKALEAGVPPVRFHFFGRDTHTFRTKSVQAYVERLIPEEHRHAFEFHGYVTQEELWRERLPKMDGFVFPSRFENYPNVLLEVLALGRPTLVSRHGCMPEIGDGFPNVSAFEPNELSGFAGQLSELVEGAPSTHDVTELYRSRRSQMEDLIVRGMESLTVAAPPPAEVSSEPPAISFVVAHYRHAQWLPALFASLAPALRPTDEVIVVDDSSGAEQSARAKDAVDRAGHTFISTSVNSGPAAARNLGAARARNELLFFVDADDEVMPSGVDALRQAMARNPGLDVATGWMRVFSDQNHCWASFDPSPSTILAHNSSHVGILIRRRVFEQLGGYRQGMRLHLEDWELHMRLVLTGARFEAFPFLAYRYRVDLRGGRNASNPERFLQSYEVALRSALGAQRAEDITRNWPAITDVLVAKFAAAPPPPPPPPELPLRYKLADSINTAAKRTPLHRVLKWAANRRKS